MRAGVRGAAVALALLVVAGSARAQDPEDDPFGRRPSSAGPALDSVRLGFALEPEWRGFLLGSAAGSLWADIAIAGRPTTAAGRWGLAAHVHGVAVRNARVAAASNGHLGGGLSLLGYLDDAGRALALVTDAYWLPDTDDDQAGLQVGLRLSDVTWRWGLEEVNPTLGVGLYRDFGRLSGLRAEVDFDLGFGVQNVAFWVVRHVSAWIEGRAWLIEYEKGVVDADALGGRAGLGVALDQGLLALVVRGGWTNPLDAGDRMYGEVALRVWPDGRAR